MTETKAHRMDRIVPRRPCDLFPRRGSFASWVFAINDAQNGDEHSRAKALKGFWRPKLCWKWSMMKTAIHTGAVYTVRFAGVIYVLHAFQKKSRKGIETAEGMRSMSSKARLKTAEAHYRENYGKGAKK